MTVIGIRPARGRLIERQFFLCDGYRLGTAVIITHLGRRIGGVGINKRIGRKRRSTRIAGKFNSVRPHVFMGGDRSRPQTAYGSAATARTVHVYVAGIGKIATRRIGRSHRTRYARTVVSLA